MYIILVYDIEAHRLAKVLKLCRQYLVWIQNSTFEGELSPLQYKELQGKLKKIINPKKDSIIIFYHKAGLKPNKQIIGISKNEEHIFL
ncbi:CRISPR-associated endonuclease Cas2 [Sphingobacteriales bacterium UPWRP_1]|nr:CRISPR-associated endonuclease Cas2 [Sphingobacteriales bacterium UPWRP_1]